MDDDTAHLPRTTLSLQQLRAQITELAGHLNAAHHRWLVLIAEFDRRHGWSDGSTQSCAHWLNWQCGLDLGAAREKVRVAHAMENLPRISAAMQRGALSYSKVRALTRIATEATEEYLLSIALHGTASHVETLVRAYRRVQETQQLSREARQQASRSLSYHHNEDGALVLRGCLPAEVGALLIQALNAALRETASTVSSPGRGCAANEEHWSPPPPRATDASAETQPVRTSLSARRADALGRLAEAFLKHGPAALNGGERQQIVVHVDAETLRDGVAGLCELDRGPSLAVETVRRLACDASAVSVVENAQGEPLNVGRKTRTVPAAMRRALSSRDRRCRFPGCSHTHYLDAHHIRHWAQGGETRLSNLALLCRFHHRQVHEGRVEIQVLDDGALRFVTPDGRCFDSEGPDTRSASDWRQLSATHREQGIHIDECTARTLWRGERMDYGIVVASVLNRARRRRNVSAESEEPHSQPF